ncbi:hypothetical protein BDN72DRAFT_905931 [Pluteus cervinus]|uniref:Uncharacterized protein n=1 Tax=Pluteus cervinus TaxID=181527 RepID=A0ACD3A128_9AGAR|nr:hypothetical protein BDN72DRAFT_905931 [Pluteus cervinus]
MDTHLNQQLVESGHPMGLTASTVRDLPGAFDAPDLSLHQQLPLDHLASDPSFTPAVPANIFEAGSVDQALLSVDQWLAASLERSKEAQHAVLCAMAARLKEALREKFALKASVEPLEECVRKSFAAFARRLQFSLTCMSRPFGPFVE